MIEKALFKDIKLSVLNDLSTAKKEIKIAVAWFTNHEYYNALLKKIKEGVKVTLIIINDPINNREGGLDWQAFINLGGILHFSHYPNIMHHKFCIIDDVVLYNGSYNWTYYAEKINRENTIRFQNNESLLADFSNEFDELILKYKRYKRVKAHSLEDLLKFKIDRAFGFNITKELKANISWLTKSKKYDLAKRVIETVLKMGPDREKLEPALNKINILKRQIIKAEIVNTAVQKELQIIQQKKIQLTNSSRSLISNSQANTRSNSRSNTSTYSIINVPSNKKQNISDKINANLVELKIQEELLKSIKKDKFQGDYGELRFNLKWSTYDDLDLHLIDPSNNHIYYNAKEAISKGSKGVLDVDANAGEDHRDNPQENIFWEFNPPNGTYKIIVNHYANKQQPEVPFILSIISQKGLSKIIYSKVHFDEIKTMLVAQIKYTQGKGVTQITEFKTKTTV